MTVEGFRCPACHGRTATRGWSTRRSAATAESFRPASNDFGATAGPVGRCATCGHLSVVDPPDEAQLHHAYEGAADEVSLREEEGQVATADRDLAAIEELTGRRAGQLVDIGCWTGSFVAAAGARGWRACGIEPSAWAVHRATERGLDVRQATLERSGLAPNEFDVVVATDIIEHLVDLDDGVKRLRALMAPDGVLFCTVPDAGSLTARLLGRRWWAVLPMHVQYFTRQSLGVLLARHGLEIRSISTHPKLFSRRYYLERLTEFAPSLGAPVARTAERIADLDRPIALDFADRIAVVAGPAT
jgi:2-polyprenyl-3-methyl-5-hydroxy-6-metoxy-1,4-benzoquinol methylase